MTSTFKLGSNLPAIASRRVVFPEDGGPSRRVILHTIHQMLTSMTATACQLISHAYGTFFFKKKKKTCSWNLIRKVFVFFLISKYLDGLIMPDASLRIVSFVLFANRIPHRPRADSVKFIAEFRRVGRALLPI